VSSSVPLTDPHQPVYTEPNSPITQSAGDYSRSAVGTLVISPTRELATQIAVEAEKLVTHHKEYTVQLLVGGESRRAQIRNWKKGRLDVVVATPGRLRDLLEDTTEDGDMIRQALAQTNLVSVSRSALIICYHFGRAESHVRLFRRYTARPGRGRHPP
jgi:hypothetical protein